ncbi:hypothetical protein GCM10027396_40240 [Insolitispirillum peregrinum]
MNPFHNLAATRVNLGQIAHGVDVLVGGHETSGIEEKKDPQMRWVFGEGLYPTRQGLERVCVRLTGAWGAGMEDAG